MPRIRTFVEDVAVAFDVEGLGLRAGRDLLVGAVEVVLEGDVFGVEVVAEDVDGGVAGFGAAGSLAGVVDDDGLGGVGGGAAEGDVGLIDDDLLAVAAGGDEDGAAVGGMLSMADWMVLYWALPSAATL